MKIKKRILQLTPFAFIGGITTTDNITKEIERWVRSYETQELLKRASYIELVLEVHSED